MADSLCIQPTSYHELLQMLDIIFRQAPYYGDLGPPMYMIMARIMNTQGGFSAFTKMHLNEQFKKLFQTWSVFLLSKDSRYVLVEGQISEKYWGWFSHPAKIKLMEQYDQGRTFEEVFICEPTADYHGYTSYEDFFNRRFREVEIDRPVTGGVSELRIVSAPCEAAVYTVQDNVQYQSDFFIKDEAYSLKQLFYNDPLIEQFVGGTVIQGFLNTTGYHRWHSPVNGRILKIVDVPGTYFAQAPDTLGDPIPNNDTELPPYLKSLRYFSHTNARQLIFIESENTDVGLLCFISIGMTEISTCQNTTYDGEDVVRGDELGMFHFGGSSFALAFTPGSKAKIDGKFRVPGVPIKINEAIAAVDVNA